MNSVVTMALAAGLLAAAFATIQDGSPEPVPQPVLRIVPVSSADPSDYRVTAFGGDRSCRVSKGKILAVGGAELRLEPACAELFAALATVKSWRERPDGSVSFEGGGVDPVVTFGIGDGVQYESFRPASPLLTLSRID